MNSRAGAFFGADMQVHDEMQVHFDRPLLSNAVERRVENCRRNLAFNFAMGFVIALLGITLLVLIWIWLRSSDAEVVKQAATVAATMISAGAGGFFFKQALTYRQFIMIGKEWIEIYEEARRPPPHELLDTIEERILNWLESSNGNG